MQSDEDAVLADFASILGDEEPPPAPVHNEMWRGAVQSAVDSPLGARNVHTAGTHHLQPGPDAGTQPRYHQCATLALTARILAGVTRQRMQLDPPSCMPSFVNVQLTVTNTRDAVVQACARGQHGAQQQLG